MASKKIPDEHIDAFQQSKTPSQTGPGLMEVSTPIKPTQTSELKTKKS